MKNIFKILLLLILFQVSANAFDNTNFYQFGDFSSRSILMQNIDENSYLTREQRDVLEKKKLTLTTKCLLKQVQDKNIENVQLLIDAKINVNEHKETIYPIYLASKNNDFEMVKLLFENGAKLDLGFGSELFEAIKNKNSQMAIFLIENGAKINYIDTVTTQTPIYLSLKNDMIDVAKLLISKNARIDNKTYVLLCRKKLTDLLDKNN